MATLTVAIESPVADAKGTEQHSSVINSLIPELIKRRTGRLPSIRKSLTIYPPSKTSTLPPPSPPPPYMDPPALEGVGFGQVHDGSSDCSLDSHASSDWDFGAASDDSRSGVRWKYVSEGSRLVRFARREAGMDSEDAELTRKMYLDGVGYLLKGLPNLSSDEIAQLSRDLPELLLFTDQHRQSEDDVGKPDGENYVCRLVTLVTMYSVLFLAFILPLLRRSAAALYRYDQRYHISNRVAETTTQTLSAWAQVISTSLNEGKAGQALLGMTLYTVEGASKGFFDGYSQALQRQNAALRDSEGRDLDHQLKE